MPSQVNLKRSFFMKSGNIRVDIKTIVKMTQDTVNLSFLTSYRNREKTFWHRFSRPLKFSFTVNKIDSRRITLKNQPLAVCPKNLPLNLPKP
jgi:hypothetical protein